MRIFKVEDTDKRRSFVTKSLRRSQKVSGKDVEYFSQETGFTLLQKQDIIRYNKFYIQRALAAAKLSMEVPLELREFYYTLGARPDLVKAFEGCQANAIYPEVLKAIKNVEILCDVGRENFCIGNLSKGFIYYTHSEHYGDKDRRIAFTERIARSVITNDELEGCQNIIVLEKNAAATRLVDLNFSELSNSVIVTVGGNFSRAIWELTKRFLGKKNIIFLADGDVYGIDMLRTIQVGTEASRHLDYKFPPSIYPSIYLAGLYPSVAEDLDLPNDKEQKRPSQRPATRKRIRFLQRYGLVDERDVTTWLGHDKTYELESLSTTYRNNENKPVGLAIYLVEYMRLHNIPCKPPLPPDDELEREFREKAIEELKREVDQELEKGEPTWPIYELVSSFINDIKEDIKEVLLEELMPKYQKVLDQITAKEIKYHIYKQFEAQPERATYDLYAIAHKIKEKFIIEVGWEIEDLKEEIKECLEKWKGEVDPEDNVTKEVIFTPLHNETSTDNEYDLVLRRLGVDMEDAYKVREALEKRFNK